MIALKQVLFLLTKKVKNIRLSGGGARSSLWRQIQADIYGQEVEIIAADEGAAYGAAILAAVGAKQWPSVDAACAEAVKVAKRITPRADRPKDRRTQGPHR